MKYLDYDDTVVTAGLNLLVLLLRAQLLYQLGKQCSLNRQDTVSCHLTVNTLTVCYYY